MAVKASATISIYRIKEVTSTTNYYLLQSSTAAAPSKPTTDSPGGKWTTSEPAYTDGSTLTLYTVIKTKYSDNTFEYTPVSKSTSYEAAKSAYNKAVNAQNTANSVNNEIKKKYGDASNYSQLNDQTANIWNFNIEKAADGNWYVMKTLGRDRYISDKYECVEGEKLLFEYEISTSVKANKKNSTTDLDIDYVPSSLGIVITDDAGGNPQWIYATPRTLGTKEAIPVKVSAILTIPYTKNPRRFSVFLQTEAWNNFSGTLKIRNIRVTKISEPNCLRYQVNIKAKTAITANRLIVGDDSGYFHIIAGSVFDLSKPILYSGANIAVNAVGNNNYSMHSNVNLRNNFANITLTDKAVVYIKGSLNGKWFTVNTLTSTVPTSDDGYYYISLGTLFSTYQSGLNSEHPIFKYVDGAFKNVSQLAYDANKEAKAAKTVILSDTAPSDTTKIWYNTDENNFYEYNTTEKQWKKINDLSGELLAINQSISNARSYSEELTQNVTNNLKQNYYTIDEVNKQIYDNGAETEEKYTRLITTKTAKGDAAYASVTALEASIKRGIDKSSGKPFLSLSTGDSSGYSLRIQNDSIVIYKGSDPVSTWYSDKFDVAAIITKTLGLGNFDFVINSDGSISFRKVRGN